jgi:hypothetical protein
MSDATRRSSFFGLQRPRATFELGKRIYPFRFPELRS